MINKNTATTTHKTLGFRWFAYISARLQGLQRWIGLQSCRPQRLYSRER